MEGEETIKSVIAEDIEVIGSIKCESNIEIGGKLNGDLVCNGNALLGSTAVVKGNISVNSVMVQGHINGNITAKDQVELKSTARVNGDIRAKRLIVEDGVTFVGKSEVNPSGSAATRPHVDTKTSAKEADYKETARENDASKGKTSPLYAKK